MPATFTKIFAEHITKQTGYPAVEAAEGMILEGGKIYVAPGGFHMTFAKNGLQTTVKLNDGPQVNFCRPAVDVMIDSLIDIYKGSVLAVILTGMGADGAESCRRLRQAGGRVLAQDQATSVVWGMPGAVAKLGVMEALLPLDKIAPSIRELIV
jgi:two-component system chemotaxis response regulator CheB